MNIPIGILLLPTPIQTPAPSCFNPLIGHPLSFFVLVVFRVDVSLRRSQLATYNNRNIHLRYDQFNQSRRSNMSGSSATEQILVFDRKHVLTNEQFKDVFRQFQPSGDWSRASSLGSIERNKLLADMFQYAWREKPESLILPDEPVHTTFMTLPDEKSLRVETFEVDASLVDSPVRGGGPHPSIEEIGDEPLPKEEVDDSQIDSATGDGSTQSGQ